MGSDRSLSIRPRGTLLTRSYIERVSEHIQRAQLAVLNGIDPEKITQAMQVQCRLAANGDREALKFVLSMVGMSNSPSEAGRRSVEIAESERPSMDDVVGYGLDEDDVDDGEDDVVESL